MKTLVVLFLVAPYPAALGSILSAQFQAQDALGQYNYGYSGDSSAKREIQTHDGVTRGTFSYVDGNGHVQSRSYVADDVHGFRVVATDLPLYAGLALGSLPVHDTPEVVAAKIAHAQAHAEALAREHGRRRRSLGLGLGLLPSWYGAEAVAVPHTHSVLVAGPAPPSAALVGPTSASAALAGPSGAIIAPGSSSGSVLSEHGVTVLTPPVNGGAVVSGPAPAQPHLLLDTPEVVAARIAHAQAHAQAVALHGRRRRSLGVEAVVGPSAPETIIAGPDGAGVVIAPATPGGSVVIGHGVTAVNAPAAPAVVLAAPAAHGASSHSDDSYEYSDY